MAKPIQSRSAVVLLVVLVVVVEVIVPPPYVFLLFLGIMGERESHLLHRRIRGSVLLFLLEPFDGEFAFLISRVWKMDL